MGSDSQHTQTVDARHRITVADQVASIPAVLAKPPLPLFFAYGPVVHRQVFHPSSPAWASTRFFTFRVLLQQSPQSRGKQPRAPEVSAGSSSPASFTQSSISPPSDLVAAVELCCLTCAHARSCVPKCLFCIGLRKRSFFFSTGNNFNDFN